MSYPTPPSLGPDDILLAPLRAARKPFYAAALALSGVGALGFVAWVHQLRSGLGTTGLGEPVYWGFYIANFVFFTGLSLAGTFISAILRLSHAEWRRPITRAAEVITVLALVFGALNVLADIGHPDRIYHMLLRPNLSSPLMWDALCIGLYFAVSCLYLYLPLVPDIALLRDRGERFRWLYRRLAMGWQGTDKQRKRLDQAIAVLAVLVIPIAVSVHTVVSFIFATTTQPMWHSTIFGPYFVVGAVHSGIAAVLVVMVLVRHFHHLQGYIKPIHFYRLGTLLVVTAMVWLYFQLAEIIPTYYAHEPEEMAVLLGRLTGRHAPLFWITMAGCFVIPMLLLSRSKWRTIGRTTAAAACVIVGMWFERVAIVVPTLVHPRVPMAEAGYWPTWVELSITAGSLATLVFLYLVFTKFFPIVSIWEIREGRERSLAELTARVSSYLPDPLPAPTAVASPASSETAKDATSAKDAMS